MLQFCTDNGGKLAEIMKAEETKDIDGLLRLKEWPDDLQFYWIGLTDPNGDGVFRWTSTGSVPDYAYWDSGEPSKDAREDCAHLNYASQNRTWNDRPCDDSFLYALCQKGWSLTIIKKIFV